MVDQTIRPAGFEDVPAISQLIHESVRELHRTHYTREQREGALGSVFDVDRSLIADGTYFAVECQGSIVGCGGWSRRHTLFGSAHSSQLDAPLIDPESGRAKIRAFFVHPNFARRGIATLILKTCEGAAMAAGFRNFELVATLAGIAFYRSCGYVDVESLEIPLPNGHYLPALKMIRSVPE